MVLTTLSRAVSRSRPAGLADYFRAALRLDGPSELGTSIVIPVSRLLVNDGASTSARVRRTDRITSGPTPVEVGYVATMLVERRSVLR